MERPLNSIGFIVKAIQGHFEARFLSTSDCREPFNGRVAVPMTHLHSCPDPLKSDREH